VGVDFPKHYAAAQRIVAGAGPFPDNDWAGWPYPVFTALIYAPLAFFTRAQAELIWDACNALYIAAALVIVAVFCRPTPGPPAKGGAALAPSHGETLSHWSVRHWPSVAALIMAFFAPGIFGVADGNIEPLKLLLIVGMVAALLHRADTTAGVLLACLSGVKVLPVLFLFALAAGGRRRAVTACLASLAVYGVMLGVTGLWRWDWVLFTRFLPDLGYDFRHESSSLGRIILKSLFPAHADSRIAMDRLCRGIALAVLTGALASIVGRRKSPEWTWRDGLGIMALSLPLMTPLLEYHHYVWALPAYLFLFHDAIEGRLSRRRFFVRLGLWCGVFACRYAMDLKRHWPYPPLYVATLIYAALWIIQTAPPGRRRGAPVA